MDLFVARPLTEDQKQIIRDTVPVIEREGGQLTNEFYKIMMRKHPQTSSFFNKTDQKLMRQPKIMAYLLLRYAQCIDDLAPLQQFIEQIVNKHIGLQIIPEHYTYFGQGLMDAFVELLEDEATPEFLEAWLTAYANLAKILIDMEKARNAQLPYTGFREFEVVKLVQESPTVRLVYFSPVGPHQIVVPIPGQYVCIRWQLPGEKEQITRTYSVSWVPQDGMYRILVRHLPKGVILGHVHTRLAIGDKLWVAHPGGQFHYTRRPIQMARKWVFIIGGIGITPAIPIMQTVLDNNQSVVLLWSNKTPDGRPFVDMFRQWVLRYPKFSIKEFFTKTKGNLDGAIDHAVARRIDYPDLKNYKNDTHLVHLVGPRGMMSDVKLVFDSCGFTNLTAEFYGPTLFLFME